MLGVLTIQKLNRLVNTIDIRMTYFNLTKYIMYQS